jgi:hypothetical protein
MAGGGRRTDSPEPMDWKLPLSFANPRHTDLIEAPPPPDHTWRIKEKVFHLISSRFNRNVNSLPIRNSNLYYLIVRVIFDWCVNLTCRNQVEKRDMCP